MISEFWVECRQKIAGLPEAPPPAWSFGASPAQADQLLALALSGVKTATSASGWDHEFSQAPLPTVGQLSILLDGAGKPAAVIETTSVNVVPFDAVSESHAYREGENDRTLESWRAEHELYWRKHSQDPRGFHPHMPVVCEQFRLLHSKAGPDHMV